MKGIFGIPIIVAAFSVSMFSSAEDLKGVGDGAVFSNLRDLNIAINSSVENTITNGDSLTLILDEVVISDKLADKARIVEIECEFVTYDGKSKIFSTVQRSLVEKGQAKTTINTDYNEVISSQPLANVEKILLKFNLRPVTDEGAEMFKNISRLLSSAIPDSPAINVVRSVIPSPAGEDELPPITATFHIPNNFYHFEKVKSSGLSTPIFQPDKPVEIVFTVEEKSLPSDVLKNIFNAVTNSEYFKDENLISGYVKVTPTKLLKKQINRKIMDRLTVAYNFLVSQRDGKLDLAEAAIAEAETMLDVYYPDQSGIERINSKTFIMLLRLFSQFENGIDYELAPKFASWVSYTNEFAAIHGIDKVMVDDFYANDVAALFYFPTQMDNYLVSGSLYMQKQFHLSMKGLDKDKWGHLINRVSESTANINLAQKF